jgi:hypothetical protein
MGYTYRALGLIFQKDSTTGRYNKLVSLSTIKEDRYKLSSTQTWNSYTYSDSTPLLTVSSLSVSNEADEDGNDNHTLTCTVSKRNYTTNSSNVLDGTYYIRLAKYNSAKGTWDIVTDPDCYGPYSSTRDTKICNYAFSVGNTYTGLKFEHLDPDSQYRLQFYALADTDYDNYLNTADNDGTPLSERNYSDTDFAIYTINKDSTGTTGTTLFNSGGLYEQYLGITSSSGASKYITKDSKTGVITDKLAECVNSSKVMICASTSIKTLDSNVRTSLGTSQPSIDIETDKTLKLTFTNTSGLENIKTVEYELIYNSEDGTHVDERSGLGYITKPEAADGVITSVMDNNKTSGTATLTITNNDWDYSYWSRYRSKGTYSIILYFYDADNKLITKYDNNEIEFF